VDSHLESRRAVPTGVMGQIDRPFLIDVDDKNLGISEGDGFKHDFFSICGNTRILIDDVELVGERERFSRLNVKRYQVLVFHAAQIG